MQIAVIQPEIFFADGEKNFRRIEELVAKAAEKKPDVILLPELWPTGFYPKPIKNFADTDGTTKNFLAALARRHNVNIVGGTAAESTGGEVFNLCRVFDRAGREAAQYKKTHLFSPLGEHRDFAAGDGATPFLLDGVKCAVAVCYDIRFPEFIRAIALRDTAVLFVAAAWPTARLSHWRTLTKARAVENQMFVVAANAVGTFPEMKCAGHSAVIDAWGEIIAEAADGESIITAKLNLAERARIKESINVFADRRNDLY